MRNGRIIELISVRKIRSNVNLELEIQVDTGANNIVWDNLFKLILRRYYTDFSHREILKLRKTLI